MKRALGFFSSLLVALAAAPFASLARHAYAQPAPSAPKQPTAAALAQPAPAAPKLTRAPKLVKFVEAAYPEAEKAAGKTASVVLRLGITAEGKVDAVLVTSSAGAAFDDAATAAVKQFEFEPAEIDGKPAAIRIEYRYDFVLRDEPPKPAPSAPAPGATAPGATSPGATSPGAALPTATAPEPPPEAPPAPQRPPDTDDLELVVVAPPTRKQVVSTEVNAEQARRVAGTQGDVLKVVENLPGVARSSVGSGQLVVWGAAPQDTRVYIDGVRVPLLYHSGGLRSVVASDLVQGVELSPGAYGAAYGRGLGGLVTVQLRPLEGDGFHGAVSADFLDASALVRASAGDFRFAAAARHGYLDALLPLVTKQDTGALFQVPRYYDGQVRAAWVPSPRTSVEVGGLLSSDTVERTVASADPSLQKSDTKRTDWTRVYARYRTEGDGGAVTTLTPWGGADSISQVSRFGRTPTELSTDSVLVGLRATHRRRVLDVATLTLGLDAEAQIASLRRAGSVTSPPREGDVHVFGQPPSDQINVDRWGATIASAAPYAEADVTLLEGKLHVLPGLRFEPYLISASRRTPVVGDTPSIGSFKADIELEPRLAATVDVSSRLRVKAAYGLYHQPPQAEDLSAVFGNPLLSTSTAHHFLVGAAARVTDTISVETTAFLALTDHLAARSQLAAPLLSEALVQVGAGRAYGAQLLVRKELSAGFFGWISYSLLRSERQDAPGARYRLFDFDQTHVFTLVATHELPWGIEVGTRLRIASGMPRTPVIGAYYDAQRDLYQPLFGDKNTSRIPPFVQVDVRASKKLRAGPTELEIYLDVQNVMNRSNPEEIVYSDDYTQRATITGLPILPSLGLRCTW